MVVSLQDSLIIFLPFRLVHATSEGGREGRKGVEGEREG